MLGPHFLIIAITPFTHVLAGLPYFLLIECSHELFLAIGFSISLTSQYHICSLFLSIPLSDLMLILTFKETLFLLYSVLNNLFRWTFHIGLPGFLHYSHFIICLNCRSGSSLKASTLKYSVLYSCVFSYSITLYHSIYYLSISSIHSYLLVLLMLQLFFLTYNLHLPLQFVIITWSSVKIMLTNYLSVYLSISGEINSVVLLEYIF